MKKYLLAKRMIVSLFMPFAFTGLMGIFFSILFIFIDNQLNLTRIATPLVIGIVSLSIAIRSKFIFFEEETGTVHFVWGKIFPLKYKIIPRDSWGAIKVEKRYPVMVMPSGSSVRVSSLPPRWDTIGLTKRGKSILLSESKTEKDALAWQEALAKSFGIQLKTFRAKIYLNKQEPFLKKDRKAKKLYNELCATNNWDSTSISNFNIPLLASNVQIKKPWKVIKHLQEKGWIAGSQEEIDQLVVLEKKYGWATPSML